MTPGNPPRSGLWLTALFLLIIGGAVTACIYYFGGEFMTVTEKMRLFFLTLFITCLAVGITVISASAHWWLDR
jgi:hypothetical protein